ncbi:MAG: hypothetical protein ACMUHB_01380 [Thermoplasmatota archaeon]
MEKERNEPARRTFRLLRGNLLAVSLLTLFNFVVLVAAGIILQVVALVATVVGLIGAGLLALAIYLMDFGGGLTVLGILVFILFLLVLILLVLMYLATIIAAGILGSTVHMFTAERLHDLAGKGTGTLDFLWKSFKTDWRRTVKRGSKLFLVAISVILPMIIILDLVFIGTLAAWLWSYSGWDMNAIMSTAFITGMVFLTFLFTGFFLILTPFFRFVIDDTTLWMAKGEGARRALGIAFTDLRASKQGVMNYMVFSLLFSILLLIIPPLIIISPALEPIITKSFLIANRDDFFEPPISGDRTRRRPSG